jgi:hypothetical protein
MMPAYVALPSEHGDTPIIAPVIAAIPVSEDRRSYVVTVIDPSSPPHAPAFLAAVVNHNERQSWWDADETTEPAPLGIAVGGWHRDIAEALSAMAALADLSG